MASEELGSHVRRAATPATQIFWLILFTDIGWLFFQYGGLAVRDILVHGVLLFLATLALACDRECHVLQRRWYVWLGLPLLVGLVQLLTVSPEMLAYLNPVKYRIVGEVKAIFPSLTLSDEMTMMPVLHRFRLGLLAMDVYLVVLLLMAQRPSRKLIAGFVHIMASAMALLNILAASERLAGLPLLSRFEGTYGGLVNPNHFATLSAVWIVFLLGFLFIRLKKIIGNFNQPNMRQAAFEGLGSAALTVLCLGLTLISFRSVYSRSGLVTLFLMLMVLAGYGLWHLFSGVNRRLRLGVCVGLVLTVLLFFPLGRGIDKFAEKALDNLRVTQFKIGMDYLAEYPVLGVGLGSTKSILHPLVPRETVYDLRLSTDFHNEYLQIAVEYGLIGILVIASLLAWLLWRLWPRRRGSFSTNMFQLMVWCMVAGFAFHSLFSFPMRITAIRVLCLVMVAFALKLKTNTGKQPCPKLRLFAMSAVMIALTASFALRHYPASKFGTLEPGSLAHRAYRYGDYHLMLKYQANDQLQKTLAYLGDIEGLEAHMAETRRLFERYLEQQPYSLQGLNGLFMLEIIAFRLENQGFDAERFEAWEAKVKAINKLGKNRNINARLAKFFLYANFLEHLTPAQASYYETMKAELAFRYRDAEEKAEQMTPTN